MCRTMTSAVTQRAATGWRFYVFSISAAPMTGIEPHFAVLSEKCSAGRAWLSFLANSGFGLIVNRTSIGAEFEERHSTPASGNCFAC